MFSGVRGFVLALAAVVLIGGGAVHQAQASDDTPVFSFAESAPSPAEPIQLTLDRSESASLEASRAGGEEEVSILPVPVPPALLCLLTAFAGLVVLGRRRADVA